MSAKIAVIGAVNGKISTVFGKLAALHAKNNFSFALIAGELFDTSADSDAATNDEIGRLLRGEIEVPVTTYFAIGKQPLPADVLGKLRKDGEVCSNLFALGRKTTIKTSEGIRIVALGGVHHPGSSETELDAYTPQYFDSDAKSMKGINAADVMLTSDWPSGVTRGSQVLLRNGDGFEEQQAAADLCVWLKPRYHFSTSTSFYEREPFFHAPSDESTEYRMTRFISLAAFGNTEKQKWVYAFSIDTKAALPTSAPPGTTACPLALSSADKKRKLDSQSEAFSRFGDANGTGTHHRHRPGKRFKGPPPMPSQCFFCLSNANVATHLITSIGDNAYLTTAKGPLPTSTTFPALNFPGHMLIIPLEHSPSAAAIPESDSRGATIREMRRYRRALQRMISARCQDVPEADRLGAVTWEISRAGGVHFHQQLVPISRTTISKGLVEAGFKVQAENESYPKFESTVEESERGDQEGEEGQEEEAEREDYFRVWISDCEDLEKVKVMTLFLDSSFRFDLQFGRKVLAKLLGLEGRSDWRNCGQTQAEEEADVEGFKSGFKEYDFTLEE